MGPLQKILACPALGKPLLDAVCLITVFCHVSLASDLEIFSESSTSHFWKRLTSDGNTHYTFLLQRGDTQRSPLLYHSVWAKDSSLVDCYSIDDPSVTSSYMSKCRGSSGNAFSDMPDTRFNISGLWEKCVPAGGAAYQASVRKSRDLQGVDLDHSSHQSLVENSRMQSRRVKRAWMIPGTLWCGSGNRAANYSDLGVFEETDKCCREHDHCRDTIASFRFSHGIFNRNIFTMSHCDCDTRFRRCLKGANDRMSDVVGYGYFNLLGMKCFEFSHKMECGERTWLGRCLFSEMTPYAVVKGPTDYNSSLPNLEDDAGFMNQSETGGHPSATSEPIQPITLTDANTDGVRATTEPPTTSSVTSKPPRLSESSTTAKSKLLIPEQDTRQRGKVETCVAYKELDKCRLHIPPMQERFGLRNTGLKTLYHCNCTTRLAQTLSQRPSVDENGEIHSLMLDFVSQSCFSLGLSEDCTNSKSCPALSTALPVQKLAKDLVQWRHLGETTHKAKKFHSKRSKRRGTPVRLYRKCLRIHSKLLRKKRLRLLSR